MDTASEEGLKRCDQTDPESRIREIRMSGSMRGEVETRNRQLRSVQSASSHFAYSTTPSSSVGDAKVRVCGGFEGSSAVFLHYIFRHSVVFSEALFDHRFYQFGYARQVQS